MAQPIAPGPWPDRHRDVQATPGSLMFWFETEMASEATTKNQAPDMDIIMFHSRAAPRKASPGARTAAAESWKTLAASQLGRHRAHRLVQAERHVPGPGGEDREDRGALHPEEAAREQGDGQ